MSWIGNHVLLFVTDNEEFIIFDPFSLTRIETHSMTHLDLLYHTHFVEETPGGGPKPHKKMPFVSLQDTVSVYLGRFYLFGMEGFVEGRIMLWEAVG